MKRWLRSRATTVAVLLATATLAACRDDGFAGTYTATSFTYAQAGGAPMDVLAAGGGITLNIGNDFSTSGSMSIPASVTGGSAINIGLLGTSARNNDHVELSLVQGSFMSEMYFTYSGSSMTGAGTFSGVSISLTLSK
jgi:hypothetical protein